MLDFVKSVDAVYKEARLLRASVRNNEKIDRALESVINVAFYTCLTFITLSFLGHDPLYLFASLSAILIGFAFIIGPAAARAFEGMINATMRVVELLLICLNIFFILFVCRLTLHFDSPSRKLS